LNTTISNSGAVETHSTLSSWSMVGALILLICFAFISHFNFLTEIQSFISIYSGIAVLQAPMTIWAYISLVINLSTVMFGLAILSALFTPKTKSYNREFLSKIFQKGPLPFYFLILVEEIFARFLFITVIGTWIFHAGYPTMIILLLVGNCLWAALHYYNYKDKTDRKLLVVLPQFVGGLVLGYIYLRYGFIVALLVHLTYDFIALIADKKQNNLAQSIVNTIYWVIVFLISWWILNANGILLVQILSQWFVMENFVAPGVSMWLMAAVLINFKSISNIITHMLALDRTSPVAESVSKWTLGLTIVLYLLAGVVTAGIILGFNWFLGLFSIFATNIALRAVVVAALITLFVTPKSGSAMANLWFTDIPVTFVEVFIAITFGFWQCVLIFAIAGITSHATEFIDSHN